jgi:hypothetical protein
MNFIAKRSIGCLSHYTRLLDFQFSLDQKNLQIGCALVNYSTEAFSIIFRLRKTAQSGSRTKINSIWLVSRLGTICSVGSNKLEKKVLFIYFAGKILFTGFRKSYFPSTAIYHKLVLSEMESFSRNCLEGVNWVKYVAGWVIGSHFCREWATIVDEIKKNNYIIYDAASQLADRVDKRLDVNCFVVSRVPYSSIGRPSPCVCIVVHKRATWVSVDESSSSNKPETIYFHSSRMRVH